MKLDTFLSEENAHTSVLGQTRYGKSYGAIKSLEREKRGVLYFNTLFTDTGSKWTKATGEHTFTQIYNLLKKGKKVNFEPATKIKTAELQLNFLIEQLYNENEVCDIRIAVDEVHLFKKEGLSALRRIATAGLRWEYKGVFISQRPANVNNDLLTQSTNHVIFHVKAHDQNYLKGLGYPVEEMMSKINGEKYKFVIYNEEEIKGAYQIG